MPTQKNKEQVMTELSRLHARTILLLKELTKNVNDINRILSENYPNIHAALTKRRNNNDLLSDEAIMKRLNNLIEEEEIYLPSGLKSIKEIAKELNVTQKRLKMVFLNNPRYNNLHKLLCHHRIKAACKMIDEHPNFSIEAISLECGFTSRKSFYRWFQMEVGCTPLDYQKRQIQIGGEHSS